MNFIDGYLNRKFKAARIKKYLKKHGGNFVYDKNDSKLNTK